MIKPGLERISRLLKDIPLPWQAIHVAGTNGKGSVCSYASAMLRAAHIRVGRFTSPHLIDPWDCICVDDKPVSESVYQTIRDHVQAKNHREGIEASSFEILTATAFQIFNHERVQVGVVECGMGGRYDSTNILPSPPVAVITQLGRDHEEWLGRSIEQIAWHKAGIIKQGSVCVLQNQGAEKEVAAEAIRREASSVGAELIERSSASTFDSSLVASTSWSSLPPVQRENLWCAYAAVRHILPLLVQTPALTSAQQRLQQAVQDLASGVSTPVMAGRYQTASISSLLGTRKDILLDGAHNQDAWIQLSSYVDERLRQSRDSPVAWVLAASGNRQIPYEHFLRREDLIFAVEFGSVAGMDWVKSVASDELKGRIEQQVCPSVPVSSFGTDVSGALKVAASKAGEMPLVVTGSLYLVSDILRLLRKADG